MTPHRIRFVTFLLGILGLAVLAFAGTPRTIGYQGYLKNGAGTPVHNTPVNVTFKLYSSTSGVGALWTGSPKSVTPQNGIFNTTVGPVDLPFDRSYWLGMTVENEELRQLQQLDSVPYALRAAMADGVKIPGGSFMYIEAGNASSGQLAPACGCDVSNLVKGCPTRNYSDIDYGATCYDVYDAGGSFDPDSGEYFPLYYSQGFSRTAPASALFETGRFGGIGINTSPSAYDLDINGTVRATKFTGDGSGLTNVSTAATSVSGTLGTSHGGTGITSQPTAAGQYLRSSASGTWGIGAIQATDIPSLSGSYVDLSKVQTIAGVKTFSSELQASGGVKISGLGNGITFADGSTQNSARTDCIGRYEDNSDGTVTDCRSGLIWLKNANCFGKQTRSTATSFTSELASNLCSLTDASTTGDWRLPNKTEFMAMIASAKKQGFSNPVLTNSAGTARWTAGDPFLNVQSDCYWVSTDIANAPDHGMAVCLNSGLIVPALNTSLVYFWPVRAGQ